jgi:hypothetical protein
MTYGSSDQHVKSDDTNYESRSSNAVGFSTADFFYSRLMYKTLSVQRSIGIPTLLLSLGCDLDVLSLSGFLGLRSWGLGL